MGKKNGNKTSALNVKHQPAWQPAEASFISRKYTATIYNRDTTKTLVFVAQVSNMPVPFMILGYHPVLPRL